MKLMPSVVVTSLCGLVVAVPAWAQEEITFPSVDGSTVYADRYAHEGEMSRGTMLLFHDETGNAQQYAEIAPQLAALGFDAVAVDIRTGGSMYGGTNRTVASVGAPPTFYDDGLQDVEAALAWMRQHDPDAPVLLWGSGASADMVLVTAADHPDGVAAVLAFSPLSVLFRSDETEAASRLTAPLFVTYGTTPINELTTVSKITDAVPAGLLTLYTPPEVGAYGAMTVVEDYNPRGWQANWAAMEEFLDRVAPLGGE